MSVSGTLVKRDYEINSNNKGTVYILQLDTPVVKSLYSDYLGYNGQSLFLKCKLGLKIRRMNSDISIRISWLRAASCLEQQVII